MTKEPEKREPSAASRPSQKVAPKPLLTERQRAEARKRRLARRRQERRPHPGNALSRGLHATGREAVRTVRFLGRATAAGIKALSPLGLRLKAWVAAVGSRLAALGIRLAAWLAALVAISGRGLRWLDRRLTPRRALLVVGVLATVLLVVSQFSDYRATAIGQPGYAGIEDVIGAPRVDVRSPIDTHSVILLIVALIAGAGLVGSMRTGRRVYSLLLIGSGAATLLVTGLVDLGSGLDVGDAADSYAGTSALLLSGFWMQLAAGVTLIWTGFFLPSGRTAGSRVRKTVRTDARVPA